MLVESYKYFGYYDLLSSVGGIKSIFEPLFDILTPLFGLIFFLKLAKMIKMKSTNDYIA